MLFLEVPIKAQTELGESLLKYFLEHKINVSKEQLIKTIKEHRLYFENKPVSFLPFKIFKKGKAQVYLNDDSFKISKNDILYEDKWLIVINKPSGVPSQSSLNLTQNHAFSGVMCYLRNQKPFKSPQLFLLHRLDMDTSGVLLMSKKSSINKGIQSLFEKKQITKTYWAISKSETEKTLEKVTSYLARKPNDKHKFRFGSFSKDHRGSKFSETKFNLLKKSGFYSLYEVHPKTGRSHQIRVHMSENDHPIVGDVFYDGEKNRHLFLHAKSLSFIHPETKESLTIKAALPPHWQTLLDKLKLNP